MAEPYEYLAQALRDRYRVESELGRGGMATVFLAHDLRHERKVALKVMRPELSSALGADRFFREIQIAAQLQHPRIVPVFDSGDADGLLYYVMPYVEGETLRARLNREGQLPLEDVVHVTSQVAEALAYAHRHGVIHRDIKPENILLSTGGALVADFGIARLIAADPTVQLTSSGVAVGTAGYMSPEQGVADRRTDARTDVYALGCVTYEMLVGEPPFTGRSPREIIARHVSAPPPSIQVVRPAVPVAVERVVHTALAKAPADRFQTVEAFAHALSNSVRDGGRADGRKWRPRVLRRLSVGIVAIAAAVFWVTRANPVLDERDWVLVADFAGPQDDPGLAPTVRDLITAELNRSRYVGTFPRSRLSEVMQLAGIPETTHVDADLGKELAFRSAIRAILVGSIDRLGSSDYSIVLHVVDAKGGRDLLSVAGSAPDSDLVSGIQRLGRELRVGLGERRSAMEGDAPLRQVVTPSFAAYRKFVEASSFHFQGEPATSNRLLREALALDPDFASAWAQLGMNYRNNGHLDSAQMAFAAAFERPDRLTEPLRYRAEADLAYTLYYDIPGAIQAYDLMLRADPQSAAGYNNRALLVAALGRYEDALADLKQSVRVNPFAPELAQIALLNQTATLIALGRLRDARDVARQLTGHFRDYADLQLATATDAWTATESLATAKLQDPTTPRWLQTQAATSLVSALAATGRVTQAERLLRERAGAATGSRARLFHEARLLLAAASGQRPSEPARSLLADTTAAGALYRAIWAASVGDTSEAHRQLAAVVRSSGPDSARLANGVLFARSLLAAQRDDWKDVVDLLGPLARRGAHDSSVLDRIGSLSLRWLVGTAYEKMNRPDSAIAYWKLVVTPTRMPGREFGLRGLTATFAHYRIARTLDATGARKAALPHWRLVRSALRSPDPAVAPIATAADRALAETH